MKANSEPRARKVASAWGIYQVRWYCDDGHWDLDPCKAKRFTAKEARYLCHGLSVNTAARVPVAKTAARKGGR